MIDICHCVDVFKTGITEEKKAETELGRSGAPIKIYSKSGELHNNPTESPSRGDPDDMPPFLSLLQDLEQ